MKVQGLRTRQVYFRLQKAKDIFADFNPILVEISRFAQNSISSGVKGVVEKVPVTGKMIPLGVDLHTGEVADSFEMESHGFQAFLLDFR